MSEKRFTKIKFDGAKIRLEYELPRKDGDTDEVTLLCADAPAPEFAEAFQALAQDVIAICELPGDQLSKIKVRGVTLTYSSDIMGACITALKTLKSANAPLVINTPHLPAEAYSGDDDKSPTLDSATCGRLERLCVEAARYLNGERAQSSLFTATTAA